MEHNKPGRDYRGKELRRDLLHADPIQQLKHWLQDAIDASIDEPNAVAFATASAVAVPSVRILLVKEVSERGLTVYTNKKGLKGSNLAENPLASLLFYWAPLNRQVVVMGRVRELSDQEQDAYYAARPRGRQIGAWASKQGAELQSRRELEQAVEVCENKFEGKEVPRPAHWGGYLLEPTEIEFWQGREDRLHDRFRYFREEGAWRMSRLAP